MKKKKGEYVKCNNCGKELYRTPYQLKTKKNFYCDNKCQGEYNHRMAFEIRKCEICGKDMEVSKISSQRFCSYECQANWQKTIIGEDNPKFDRVEYNCDSCGKEIDLIKGNISRYKHHFCSNKCRQKWFSNVCSQTEKWRQTSRKNTANYLKNNKATTETKPQLLVNDILDKNNIDFENEHVCDYFAIDNYLTEYNLMIEVMGDFWHCSPIKYKTPKLKIHTKIIPRDKRKYTYIKNVHNIEILYLWESDIYKNEHLCELLILKYINNNGLLENYNSFNYHINSNDELEINDNLIVPHQFRTN